MKPKFYIFVAIFAIFGFGSMWAAQLDPCPQCGANCGVIDVPTGPKTTVGDPTKTYNGNKSYTVPCQVPCQQYNEQGQLVQTTCPGTKTTTYDDYTITTNYTQPITRTCNSTDDTCPCAKDMQSFNCTKSGQDEEDDVENEQPGPCVANNMV